ncbi:uncharacterized protein LOC126891420 [Diabrotica virgifera virgifera]|uniref:Nuclease HARBI1 n=1 Tax=Diabrotica virgifera virgifera TaxID=50390 RepID=A0ABM5L293_DIAVI|nr:uncharacterized protein LOC126891420 [Diabrotica virgifera virgifera]
MDMEIDMEDNILADFLFGGDENIPKVVNAVANVADAAENVPQMRRRVVRNENYFEHTIPRYSDIQFREHFRMSRATFQILLNCVGHIHQLEDRIIPLEKKLMFTIFLLSKPESFLAAGDRFGLPKSSGYKIFRQIIMELGRLTPQFIRWPNMQSLLQTANVFEARSRGITGVVGAIDGCHIAIRQPIRNPIDFYNNNNI